MRYTSYKCIFSLFLLCFSASSWALELHPKPKKMGPADWARVDLSNNVPARPELYRYATTGEVRGRQATDKIPVYDATGGDMTLCGYLPVGAPIVFDSIRSGGSSMFFRIPFSGALVDGTPAPGDKKVWIAGYHLKIVGLGSGQAAD